LIAETELGMARVYAGKGRLDSAIHYGRLSLRGFQSLQRPEPEMRAASFLTETFSQLQQTDSAFKYQTMTLQLKDSLFNQEKTRQVYNIGFDETLRQQQIEQEKREVQQQYKNKVRIYGLLAGLLVLSIIAGILYRNNRQKQKSNVLLQQQQAETEQQKLKAEQALEKLQTTQAQLIQKEKMASLGELTAGIAHEIQNPLNFVNNFSAVNKELLSEMKEEMEKGNYSDALDLATSVEENEEKIGYHGKRADAIVKGMLQHSRGTTGEKESTNLNQLVEEHLRLAYHGYRAKDQSFNADVSTDYDPQVDQINLVPQEIGRVLLNLFSNAFYAVGEKKKQLNGTFEPVVSVSTKKEGNNIIIVVKDNGTGMSPKVAEKVFQPFFTTKPTGEGTGLGLSLSYDIITKGHGGQLQVESIEGEESEFVILLPIKQNSKENV
jgi:signal transduction histidine kinase